MSILSRLFRVGEAKANTIVDKMEDPVEISQQILRDLSEQLQKGINSEAEIKAIALGHRSEQKENLDKATEWRNKAYALMDKADEAKTPEEKEKFTALANSAAEYNKDFEKKAALAAANAEREEKSLSVIDSKLKDLRDTIEKTKSDVEMIKSQQKTADASEKINKAMSSVDVDGLKSTLDRMKEKVKTTELRAEAYAEIDNSTASTEKQINDILSKDSGSSALDELRKSRNKTV